MNGYDPTATEMVHPPPQNEDATTDYPTDLITGHTQAVYTEVNYGTPIQE